MKPLALMLAEKSVFISVLMNAAAIVADIAYFLPAHFRRKKHDYAFQHGKIGTQPGNGALNDLPLSYFTHALLSNKYSFIIEIGAYTADRTLALKANFPHVDVIAMDVTADYAKISNTRGIELRPFSLDEIEKVARSKEGHGAIFSHGTICYMSQPEVCALFAQAYRLGLDIALVEPNTVGEGTITRSLPRARDGSWFHPYITMLKEAGYRLPINGGRQVGNCVSLFSEQVTYIFAQRLSSQPSTQSAMIEAVPEEAQ